MASKFGLKIFPAAQADLDSIFAYIHDELKNPSAAIGQIDDFANAFDNVCAFPESCPLIDNEYVKDKSLRKLIVNNYIAFYRARNGQIQIVRVLYGMRNYFEELNDRADLKAYEDAKAEYEKNPVVYTFDEVNEMLGISDILNDDNK